VIKILIEVSGGVVVAVYSSEPKKCKVHLLDWDNDKTDRESEVYVWKLKKLHLLKKGK
jgi:hypothetical protein